MLASTPGIGPTKVKRFHDTLHLPFRRRRPTATADMSVTVTPDPGLRTLDPKP